MSVKKKILMIVTSPFYQEKGSSLRVAGMLDILSSKYDVDLITYSLGRDYIKENVNIYRTPSWFKPKILVSRPTISKIILDVFLLYKAIKFIFNNQYYSIHCEDFEAAFIGRILKIFSKKTILVYDLHNRIKDNIDIGSKKNKVVLKGILNKLEKYILKKTDLVITNWKKYFDDDVFINNKKILYYDKIKLDKKEYKLDVVDYIIYTGNFEKYQGVYEFLDAYKQSNKNNKVVLVGNQTEEIKEFVKDNNLNNDVIMTGRLSIEETNYLISNALFCILPRIYGVQPSMKLIHYLVMNKPIIASDIEANHELLKDGYNCIYYKSNEDLVKMLNNLAHNQNQIKQLNNGVIETKQFILQAWNEENIKYIYFNCTSW